MNKTCLVKTSVANLYKTSSFKSELVTQALHNERLIILEQSQNWYKVRQWDDYESWIHSFYIYKIDDKNSIKSEDFSKPKNFSDNNLIDTAQELLNIPYLWGGKSQLGFDCSGFVQTVFKTFGIYLPRDSYQQMNYKGLIEIKYSEACVGDLVFFSDDNKNVNHVAICIGNGEIIHSSGYVKIEKLKKNKELYQKLYKVMSIKKIIDE